MVDEEVDSVEEAIEVRSFFSSALQGPRCGWCGPELRSQGETSWHGGSRARAAEGQNAEFTGAVWAEQERAGSSRRTACAVDGSWRDSIGLGR